MNSLVLILTLAAFQNGSVQSEPVALSGVCELFHRRAELHGKQVTIRGHFQYNTHGLFLHPDEGQSECDSVVVGFISRPPSKQDLVVEYSGEFPESDSGKRCKKLSIKAPPLVEDSQWEKFKKFAKDESKSTWIKKAREKCLEGQICEVTAARNIQATVDGFVFSADRNGQKCTGFSEGGGFRVLLVVERFRDVSAEMVTRKVQLQNGNNY